MINFKDALTAILKEVLDGSPNTPFKTEKEFRDELLNIASKRMEDWKWDREQDFACSTLNNIQKITVDLVAKNKKTGESVVIELKYAKPREGDKYAFPYDVLWDCAKIETMLTVKQGAPCPRSTSDEHPSVTYGFCIFLSCLKGHFHAANWGTSAWSRNYFSAIRSNANVITGHILTHEQNQGLDKVIFKSNRPHISLGFNWARDIVSDFDKNNNNFGLMLLTPDVQNLVYQHPRGDPRTIPFLDEEARAAWLNHRNIETTNSKQSGHQDDDSSEQLRSELSQKLKDMY